MVSRRLFVATGTVVFALGALGCPGKGAGAGAAGSAPQEAGGTEDAAAEPFEPRYPTEIAPPAGTEYPCALTPLPPGLPGIPAAERRYVDHVYTELLTAIHAKLGLLRELGSAEPDTITAAHEAYEVEVEAVLATLAAEPIPEGLEAFHADVTAALELQRTFFARASEQLAEAATTLRASARDAEALNEGWGAAWERMFTLPEGRQASKKLLAAWGHMQRRYGGWPADTKDSVYHHLCALDLF